VAEAIRWFRLVRWADVPAFERAGWVRCACLGPTHGLWSCLMHWASAGEPPTASGTAPEWPGTAVLVPEVAESPEPRRLSVGAVSA